MDNWPFEQPANTAALTTRDILEGKAAVLRVTHDADDGSWQFLPNMPVSPEDARVVALGGICRRDPTLLNVADLPEGWVAWRDVASRASLRTPMSLRAACLPPSSTWQAHPGMPKLRSEPAVTRTSRESQEHVTNAEPGLHYALIGAAFGLLLIYLGARIPLRILRWPIVCVGALFVVVMTLYAAVVLWKRMSEHVRRLLNRVRGRVRLDPQLGALTRDANAHCWVATLKRGDRTVNVVIGGDDEPDPRLLAHARDLLAPFDTLERRVEDYLASEAEKETSDDPEIAAEIRGLRISSVTLRSPARPAHVVIDFDGPDEMRYWYCDYVGGELSHLNFDT